MAETNGAASGNPFRLRDNLLAIAFAGWAGVVGYSAKLVIERIDAVQAEVGRGILPRAEERITNQERLLRQHIEWAEAQERELDAELRALAIAVEAMKRSR